MKHLWILTFFFLVIAGCTDKAKFVQASHFGNDTVQYYTFNISDKIDLSSGLTDQLKASIKEHGTLLGNSEVVTATFYFEGNAPMIDKAVGGLAATTKIQESKPIAVLWAMPDGRTQLIENPG